MYHASSDRRGWRPLSHVPVRKVRGSVPGFLVEGDLSVARHAVTYGPGFEMNLGYCGADYREWKWVNRSVSEPSFPHKPHGTLQNTRRWLAVLRTLERVTNPVSCLDLRDRGRRSSFLVN